MLPNQTPALTWTGRILSALAVFGLLASASMKLSGAPEVLEGFAKYGYEANVVGPIAGVEILSAVLFAIPQTAVLGAILIAAYLGGAVATHVAAGEPPVAPIVLAMIAWSGIALRDPRLRALLPLRLG